MPMEYYDLQRHWRKVKRHISAPAVQAALVRDFHKYTFGRWQEAFLPGMKPYTFESCDWQMSLCRRGRPPAYFEYTKHGACHWLVTFELELAQLVSAAPWRIITSPTHSCVFDGAHLIFNFTWQAMCVPPDECFQEALCDELAIGEHLAIGYGRPWRGN